ncbi:hypothetical protein K435DRAFT_697323 [Dendrothele bispora CBS 962.96]|uniref:Uncharacterized protein n=1 Tax=Dendrothele bispora (strain CBS 962.96) TaxID=1314807 RepID=A0A4S8KUS2_DENBC|nr:hypothetical protein K435DRAFT_697323 [Dendrothele bispora CBS 962.96]
MINIQRDQDDDMGVAFWSYVLNVLSRLTHQGMSDEEDEERPTSIGQLRVMEQVRVVQELDWRETSFSDLFAMVDRTRNLEVEFFPQTGKHAMKRLRSDPNRKVVKRMPPKGLPRSFFKPEYLKEKERFPHEIDSLRLSKKDFEIYEWRGYDPQRRHRE